MSRIRILDQAVADRIAAGEVVERPASVVKELIENSLDASATQVVVEIAGAGIDLIRVGDNGSGIHPDDLPVAVQRFATSKITTADDLQEIRSFGFRGEALPSIAAISLLEIASAVPGAPAGRKLRLEGGESVGDEPVGMAVGTVVTVRHLFFNTPARRKFLKSAAREFALIVETVNRLALANPQVSIRLIHEGADVARYAAGREEDRVAAVLGDETYGRMLAFTEEVGGLRIGGWLGQPDLAKPSRRHQYLFVNRRPVHNRMLGSAVEQAYQQLIPAGKFPAYLVFLDAPPGRVDVNVHPRKLEVRFDDDHGTFGAVARAVRAGLRSVALIRTIDAAPAAVPAQTAPGTLALDERRPTFDSVPPIELAAAGRLPAMRLLGQLHRTYLLAEGADGLIVIDQHAAHERVLYERLLVARARSAADGQVQVMPASVALSADAFAVFTAHHEVLTQLGFSLEPFGDRTVLVRAVPQVAAHTSPQRLLGELLAELAEGDRTASAQTLLERATITTACHTAIRAGDPLDRDHMAALVHDLAQTADPFTCFHGRPTMVTIPAAQVERWFLRR